MSNRGERSKGSKLKTLPLTESDSTHVGTPIPGWDASEATNVGAAPPGWEFTSTDVEAAPEEWRDSTVDDPTSKELSAVKPPPTAAGPPVNYPLAPGGTVVIERPARGKSDRPKSDRPKKEQPPPTQAPPSSERPAIEVEVRRVSNAVSVTRKPPAAFEIWTKNRVYALDSAMLCVEVIDLATGQTDKAHPFVGASLVGGQRRVDGGNELSFPLPVPGSDAVFQLVDQNKRPRLMVTSRVTRVLLHVQIVRVSEKQRDDTWGQLASTRKIPAG